MDCSIELNVSPQTVHRIRPERAILACAARIKLVRIYGVDRGEGFGEVGRWRFGGDQGVAAGLDRIHFR